ncbi:MAG: cell division protein ZapA [Gammaproteobacteria bacterium]
MSPKLSPVTISIFGKEYKIACPEEEQNDLLLAARQLDKRMCEIRDSGKVIGPERIAVMAALNLSHELAQLQKHGCTGGSSIGEHLAHLREKIESALDKAHG